MSQQKKCHESKIVQQQSYNMYAPLKALQTSILLHVASKFCNKNLFWIVRANPCIVEQQSMETRYEKVRGVCLQVQVGFPQTKIGVLNAVVLLHFGALRCCVVPCHVMSCHVMASWCSSMSTFEEQQVPIFIGFLIQYKAIRHLYGQHLFWCSYKP